MPKVTVEQERARLLAMLDAMHDDLVAATSAVRDGNYRLAAETLTALGARLREAL